MTQELAKLAVHNNVLSRIGIRVSQGTSLSASGNFLYNHYSKKLHFDLVFAKNRIGVPEDGLVYQNKHLLVETWLAKNDLHRSISANNSLEHFYPKIPLRLLDEGVSLLELQTEIFVSEHVTTVSESLMCLL